jgi:UDP-N-acetyl-D-glucosamine dehydrogenase
MIRLSTAVSRREELMSRVELRTARVAVVGLGYLGLPLAEVFSAAEFPVIGFDTDPERVRKLRLGQSYIGHIDSGRIAELVRSNRFEATVDPRCFESADVVILCVPTPLTDSREPDLSHLIAAGTTLSRHLRKGQLVVLESASYPGTTEEVLRPVLEGSGLRAGEDFFLAYSPEREDPGNVYCSTSTTPKVVGGIDRASRDLAVALYGAVVPSVVPVSNTRVAEASKMLENTYRAVNVALVNELKVVFDRMGIDVWEVIEAARTKPFGFQAFYPGPGLGGQRVPIDPFYLTWAARRHGANANFLEMAGEVNAAMPGYVVDRVVEALNDQAKSVKGSHVFILGVAYKKDFDDPRESPALGIMDELRRRGATVAYNDPYVPSLPATRRHAVPMHSEPLSQELLAAQDCVVIVTDHSVYKFDWVARCARAVVDTRNATEGVSAPPGRVYKA